MSSMEDWKDLQKRTEVCKKDGKYYLKGHPERLFYSYEEARNASKLIRDLIVH